MEPGLLSGGTQLVLQRLISFGGPNIKSGKLQVGGWVELSSWGETGLGSDVSDDH